MNGDERARCSMRADRNGCSTSSTGRAAKCCRPLRSATSTRAGVDMKTGRLIPVDERRPEAGRRRARHLPRGAGHEGLAAIVVLSADRPALHPAPEPVRWTSKAWRRATSPARRTSARVWSTRPGPGGNRGEVTAWDPVAAQAGLDRSRRTSRSGAARSSRRATWSSTERWRAGSRRSTRGPASCCGSSSAARGSSASRSSIRGRTATSTSPCCRGVGGWAGAMVVDDLDPRDATAGNGLGNGAGGPEDGHDTRRHALRVLARRGNEGAPVAADVRAARPVRLAALGARRRVRGPATAAARLRRSEQSAVLEPRGRRLREPDRRAAGAPTGTRRSNTPGGRSGADSCATRSTAGACDVVIGVPRDLERVRDDAALLPIELCLRVAAAARSRALRSFDDPRLRALRIGVQMIGDDFANSRRRTRWRPRASCSNVVGYSVYGDYSRPNPLARDRRRRSRGATSTRPWCGGRPRATSRAPGQCRLAVTPVSPQRDSPSLPFAFDISMGVRRATAPGAASSIDFTRATHARHRRDLLDRYGGAARRNAKRGCVRGSDRGVPCCCTRGSCWRCRGCERESARLSGVAGRRPARTRLGAADEPSAGRAAFSRPR